MKNSGSNFRLPLMTTYLICIILFLQLPAISLTIASFSGGIYFTLPFPSWTTHWYSEVFHSGAIRHSLWNSIKAAIALTIPCIILGFLSALAWARYDWRGKSLYQRFLLLPLFFPQMVLGLALLLLTKQLAINPSWITASLGHLVWILPIVTLVIAIQVYGFDTSMEEAAYTLGASTFQVFRKITLPVLLPGIFSGGLFAFLLSWSNFELSLFLQGVDNMLPVYIYGKMSGGYSPTAPALSAIVYLSSAGLLLVAFWLLTRAQK